MKEDAFQEALLKRLNVLIAVAMDASQTSVAAKIARLADLGLGPSEIGEIVGRKPNYISAVLGTQRRKSPGPPDE